MISDIVTFYIISNKFPQMEQLKQTWWPAHRSVGDKPSTSCWRPCFSCHMRTDGREGGQQKSHQCSSKISNWWLNSQWPKRLKSRFPAGHQSSITLSSQVSTVPCCIVCSTVWLASSSRPARGSLSHWIFHLSKDPVPLWKAQPIRSNQSNDPLWWTHGQVLSELIPELSSHHLHGVTQGLTQRAWSLVFVLEFQTI